MKNIYAIVLAVITLQLIACGGAEERKAVYMANADKSISIGDFEKARIELKNVLQIDPKDSAAYFKLGKIFEGKKDFRKAFDNFKNASGLDPENLEYKTKIGQYYLLLAGDINKANEILSSMQSKDPNDTNVMMLEAGILLKEDKLPEAKKVSLKIFDAHPDNIDNGIFLAGIYGLEGNNSKAIEVLDTTVHHNPDNNGLLSVFASTLFAGKEYEKAEKVLSDMKNSHPEVFANHLNLAVFYKRLSRDADAKRVLEGAVQLETNDVNRKIVLLEYIEKTEGTQNAIIATKDMIKKNPSMGQLRSILGQLQIAVHDYVGAKETYLNAIKDFSEEETGIKSRTTLAVIYMQDNDVTSASKQIQDALKIAPNDADVSLVNAKIALFNKNYEQAIISLRSVIKDKPNNIDAYIYLAAAHRAMNEPEQADQAIVRAYENNRGNIEALLPLAHYHLSNKNISEAEKIVDESIRLDKSDYDMLSIKAGILNGRKNYKEGADIAKKLIEMYPEKGQGYAQSIPYLLSQNKTKDVIKLLHTGYEKTNSIDLFKVLAEVQIRSGEVDNAISGINKLLAKSNEEALYLLLANAYIINKNLGKSMQVLNDSIKQDEHRDRSYLSLAKLLLQKGDNEKAIALLKEGISKNSENIELSVLLAGIYERDKNYEAAIALYDQVLNNSGDNVIVINNLAALLSEHMTDAESLNRAKMLADKLKESNQPVIKDTVGWVYYKTGNYNEAVDVLREVVAAAPDVQIFNYHLGMAYYKAGDKASAKTHLKKSLTGDAKYPGSEEARATLNLI